MPTSPECAALLSLALVVGCAPAREPSPSADPYPQAFGVFAAFSPEYRDFSRAMGFDFPGYQDWAGARLRELGATWSRSNLQLIWDRVEPSLGGSFDWDASFESDAVFGGAQRHGVHALAVFHEGGTLLGGPGSQLPPLRDPLSDLAAYARFVAAAVERYDGDGLDDAPGGAVIKHWQVGNETVIWGSSGRSAADYVRWFEATAEAIHGADAEAHLVLIASTDATRVDPLHATAIATLAADGVRFDAVDLHHWGRASLASSTMAAVPDYLAALAGVGLTGVELWSCEHGTYLGTPVPPPGACPAGCAATEVCAPINACVARCVSDARCPSTKPHCEASSGLCTDPPQSSQDQARSLVYRYTANRALGVKRILWNNLVGWRCFGGVCGSYWDRLGLIADGTGPGETAADLGRKRPAFYSYALLASRTEAAVADQEGEVVTGNPAAHVYAYRTRATGRRGLVAWADVPTTVVLETAGAPAQVTGLITDWDGTPLREETISAEGGRLTLALDADPIWVAE